MGRFRRCRQRSVALRSSLYNVTKSFKAGQTKATQIICTPYYSVYQTMDSKSRCSVIGALQGKLPSAIPLWGNPPSINNSLGMLIPENVGALDDSIYGINITYAADGYIEDEDAKSIDYDEMMVSMQQDAIPENEYRNSQGYESVSIVDWATPPYYDEINKLVLNAIGDISILDEVNANIDNLVSSIDFTEGNRYADFNPSMDEIAAYGIGGLIPSKVLTKAGFFAKAGIMLAKSWKIIALVIFGLMASIRGRGNQKSANSE